MYYFKAKVCTIWAHGPLNPQPCRSLIRFASSTLWPFLFGGLLIKGLLGNLVLDPFKGNLKGTLNNKPSRTLVNL